MEFIENITHEYPGFDEIRLKCGAAIIVDKDGEDIRIGIYNDPKAVEEGRVIHLYTVQKPQPTQEELIQKAVEEASQAFWMKIVDHFPNIHGDLDPLGTIAIDRAMKQAVTDWVKYGDPIE